MHLAIDISAAWIDLLNHVDVAFRRGPHEGRRLWNVSAAFTLDAAAAGARWARLPIALPPGAASRPPDPRDGLSTRARSSRSTMPASPVRLACGRGVDAGVVVGGVHRGLRRDGGAGKCGTVGAVGSQQEDEDPSPRPQVPT